jgi:hypothetical protein
METKLNTKDAPVGMHPKQELSLWYMKRSALLLNIEKAVVRTTRSEESAGPRETVLKVKTVKLGTL